MSLLSFFSNVFGDSTTQQQSQDTVTNATSQTTQGQQSQQQSASTQETGSTGSSSQNASSSNVQQRAQETGLTQNQTQVSTLFSPQDLALLRESLSRFAQGTPGADLTGLASGAVFGGSPVLSALQTRGSTPLDIEAIINKSKEAATSAFVADTLPQLSKMSGSSGSRMNSFTALLENDARARLGGELAGIEANTRLAGDKLNTDTMLAALTGGNTLASGAAGVGSANADAMYRLAAVLRGGEATTTSAGQQAGTLTDTATVTAIQELLQNFEQQSTTNQMQEMVQALLNTSVKQDNVSSQTNTSVEGQQNPGVWTAMSAIGSLLRGIN